MSGFVVGYGSPDPLKIEEMFKKIDYRGPYISGISANKQVVMAQNYLKADCPMAHPDRDMVPINSSGNGIWQICYDGQMGNHKELSRAHGLSNGPFQEERLLLHLYQKHGSDLCEYLDDAIFGFVISNGDEIFAARDLLGIKTLFYGRRDNTLYLATELKSLAAVTDDIHEFPPGHYLDTDGNLIRFAELPKTPPEVLHSDLGQMIEDIRDIIQRSLRSRVDFAVPTAGLLSGGMDSSVINYLANELHREKFGKNARLKTFAMGVGESEDIISARVLADHINSDHHELIVDLEQVVEVLPEVIYYLESFDPSLVRSSVSNFLISRYARKQGIDLLLSGEGGDEIFCGYLYLKDFPPVELFAKQMECIGFLHNNASLRLDRMNHCNSVRVVAPLISGELFRYMLAIPPEYKQKPDGDEKIEKWIFRKAFEPFLPEIITRRLKQEFSQGSGSAALLPNYFENVIGDDELAEAQVKYPVVRSKEELYYFQLFTDNFGDGLAVDTVGQWIRL
ncbi:MAG: asparagine synthase-related protein [Syntrophobacterales bacterium]|jgi:asparagine synthase (glutamine-hydrolysing)